MAAPARPPQVMSKLLHALHARGPAVADALASRLLEADRDGSGYLPRPELHSALVAAGLAAKAGPSTARAAPAGQAQGRGQAQAAAQASSTLLLTPHETLTLVRHLGPDKGEGVAAEQLLDALGLLGGPPGGGPPPQRALPQAAEPPAWQQQQQQRPPQAAEPPAWQQEQQQRPPQAAEPPAWQQQQRQQRWDEQLDEQEREQEQEQERWAEEQHWQAQGGGQMQARDYGQRPAVGQEPPQARRAAWGAGGQPPPPQQQQQQPWQGQAQGSYPSERDGQYGSDQYGSERYGSEQYAAEPQQFYLSDGYGQGGVGPGYGQAAPQPQQQAQQVQQRASQQVGAFAGGARHAMPPEPKPAGRERKPAPAPSWFAHGASASGGGAPVAAQQQRPPSAPTAVAAWQQQQQQQQQRPVPSAAAAAGPAVRDPRFTVPPGAPARMAAFAGIHAAATGRDALPSSAAMPAPGQYGAANPPAAAAARARAEGNRSHLDLIQKMAQPNSLWQTTNRAAGGVGHSASFRRSQ
jgi:hypothetical protein